MKKLILGIIFLSLFSFTVNATTINIDGTHILKQTAAEYFNGDGTTYTDSSSAQYYMGSYTVGNSADFRTMMQWDISSVPAGAIIQGALMCVYSSANNQGTGWGLWATTSTQSDFPLGVNWNTINSYEGTTLPSTTITTTSAMTWCLNVTTAVKNAYNNGYNNATFITRTDYLPASADQRIWPNTKYAVSSKPYMNVTYASATSVVTITSPTATSQQNSTNITLRATATNTPDAKNYRYSLDGAANITFNENTTFTVANTNNKHNVSVWVNNSVGFSAPTTVEFNMSLTNLVIYQYGTIQSFTNFTILWNLDVVVVNNGTRTLTNIVVNPDANFSLWTNYTIASLASGSQNLTQFTYNYTRQNISIAGGQDVQLNVAAANLVDIGMGSSNTLTLINPVDPPDKKTYFSGAGTFCWVVNQALHYFAIPFNCQADVASLLSQYNVHRVIS